MNRNKIIYHNTIPPIKADCLLPKFKIPNFSLKFSTDSTLNKPSHDFRTDALLGMKVPLCDLSVYDDCTPEPESFDEHDLMYYRELVDRTQKDALIVPVKNLIPRSHQHIEVKNQREKNQEKMQKTYYRKSKFYKSTNDPEIEEQLKNAFDGKIPQGEVHLIHQATPLCSMIDRQLAKPLNKESLILLSVGKKFLKVHDPPSEEDQPNRAKKSFSVTEKDTESNIEKAYLYVDEDGDYNLGVIRKNLILSSVPKKDMMRERLTATPVIFQNAQIVKRPQNQSEDNDNENKKENTEHNERSSSSSSRQSSRSASARNSNSSNSSYSSASGSSTASGSGSSSGDEDKKEVRHRIRAKDVMSEKKEEKEENVNNSSHSSDNEKKEKSNSSRNSKSNSSASSKSSSRSPSRSPSPKANSNKNSRSSSDSESKKSPKSGRNSRSASDSPPPKNKSNSSRSASDNESKKKSSRSSSRSASSNSKSSSRSASRSPSRSASRSPSRSASRSPSRSASRSPSKSNSSNSDNQKD